MNKWEQRYRELRGMIKEVAATAEMDELLIETSGEGARAYIYRRAAEAIAHEVTKLEGVFDSREERVSAYQAGGPLRRVTTRAFFVKAFDLKILDSRIKDEDTRPSTTSLSPWELHHG